MESWVGRPKLRTALTTTLPTTFKEPPEVVGVVYTLQFGQVEAACACTCHKYADVQPPLLSATQYIGDASKSTRAAACDLLYLRPLASCLTSRI